MIGFWAHLLKITGDVPIDRVERAKKSYAGCVSEFALAMGSFISRSLATVLVDRNRSDKVALPWTTWATMEKLWIREGAIIVGDMAKESSSLLLVGLADSNPGETK